MSNFADWQAICEVKAAYCRLLDTKDWESWGQLFTENCVLDTSDSGGPVYRGRAHIVASVRQSISEVKTAHQVHSPEITISGDQATAIWAMQDRLVWANGQVMTGFGHYHEDYLRSPNGWRIAAQRLTRLFMEMVPPKGFT